MKINFKNIILIFSIILFTILFPIENYAKFIDYEYNISNKVFENWLKEQTLDTVSEDERITEDFQIDSYGPCNTKTFELGDEIYIHIGALVTPVNPESEYWKNFEKVEFPQIPAKYRMMYYVKMTQIEGEDYKITYMSDVPDGYEEYVKRMNDMEIDIENMNFDEYFSFEYEDEKEPETQTRVQEVSAKEYKSENKIVENTSLAISIFCALMIVVCFAVYIKNLRK